MTGITSLPTPCERPSNGLTTTMPTPLQSGANAPSDALCSNAPIPPRPMEAGLWAWQPGLLHRHEISFSTTVALHRFLVPERVCTAFRRRLSIASVKGCRGERTGTIASLVTHVSEALL
jgi:hypothetical protein